MSVAVHDDNDDENTEGKIKETFCPVQIKRERMSGVGGLNGGTMS